MAAVTGIDWTDATRNYLPWHCTRVSPGCANCYALAHTDRYQGAGAFESRPPAALRMHRILLPLTDTQFRQGRRIFMESMSDPSGARLPPDDLALVWALMAADQVHIYQVLTKRRNRARRLASSLPWPPNVWLGASVETSRYLHRADQLPAVPAAVRFLSLEPLLGPLPGLDLAGIGWVIAGGESGPGPDAGTREYLIDHGYDPEPDWTRLGYDPPSYGDCDREAT